MGSLRTMSVQEMCFGLLTGILSILVLFGFGSIWEGLDFELCLEVPNRRAWARSEQGGGIGGGRRDCGWRLAAGLGIRVRIKPIDRVSVDRNG